jgi:hypothetical protein
MLQLRLLLVDQCLKLHFFLFNVSSERGSLLIKRPLHLLQNTAFSLVSALLILDAH